MHFKANKSNSNFLRSGKRISSKSYFAFYSILFCVTAFLVFYLFIINNKSFIWHSDGWKQHYKALLYYGKWLRDIVSSFIYEHRLIIPQYSFSIGYGSDIITTFHYYVIGDPLNLFSVFVPTKYIHVLYSALIIVRLYLAGLTFSWFCLYMRKKLRKIEGAEPFGYIAILAGALIYVFCGFSLFAGIRHPYFLNPMIYFPIIILGCEKICDRKRPYTFIFGVFVSALSNFYFFYMIVVFTILYAVWRTFSIFSRSEIIKAIGMLFKHLAYAVIGTFMSAVILLPIINIFFRSYRLAAGYTFDMLFTANAYQGVLGQFLSVNTGLYSWTLTGFGSLCLIAVFILYVKKGNRNLKIGFAVLFIMTLIPAVGYALNGFAYVANRWTWALGMLVSYIVVRKWRSFSGLSRREIAIISALMIMYMAACICMKTSRTTDVMIMVALCFVILVVLMLLNKTHMIKLLHYTLLLLVIAGIALNSYFLYSPRGGDYLTEFVSNERIASKLNDTEATAIKYYSTDDEFARYTGNIDVNNTMITGLNSTQFYWSLENGVVARLREELLLTDQSRPQIYNTVDSRSMLSSILNIKYYVQKSNIPYGFSHLGNLGSYMIWKNDQYLPFGYTYSEYMSRDEYDALSPLDKQEALLQACVINEYASDTEKSGVIYTSEKLKYSVVETKNLTLNGNQIITEAANAEIVLEIDGIDNAETYVYITGLEFSGISPRNRYSDESWSELTAFEKNEVKYSDSRYVEPTRLDINIVSIDQDDNSISKTIDYITPKYNSYAGRKDFTVNLGYSESEKTTVRIIFPTIGNYSAENFEIIAQPMDNYDAQVKALAEDVMYDVDFHDVNRSYSTNTVTGSIDLGESKYLLMTVPYSEGWTAYVDGQEQELLQANTAFMALYLNAGHHDIQLRYSTPGLKTGFIISIVGMIALAVLIVITELKSRKASKQKY